MQKLFSAWYLVALIVFIFLANAVADYAHLYFYFWWLDIPMHILGGIWIALCSLYVYYGTSLFKKKDHSRPYVITFALATALIVGLGWEIFEFFVDHVVSAGGYDAGDALKDLFDDALGGAVASLFFISKRYNVPASR